MAKCYYCNNGCAECQKKTSSYGSDPSPNETEPITEVSNPVKKEKRYGFDSWKCRQWGHPVHYYTLPDGSVVEVCWIDSTQENRSGWDDARCIGEVVEYIIKKAL